LAFTRATGRLIAAIRRCKRPVIAAVHGAVVGAGAVIAMAADLRLAAASARFGFIFPKVGLCGADMGATYLLPRIVGLRHASELLFFGDLVWRRRAAHRAWSTAWSTPSRTATSWRPSGRRGWRPGRRSRTR
jgi:enoyl-CoA hydratase/carnithine racemase